MKKIAVIPNRTKDKDYRYTKEIIKILSKRAEIVMPKSDEKSGVDAVFCDADLYDGIDAVIVLGGDGTILQAAEPCGRGGIPVMGINLGKIGFMTEVEVEDMRTACDRLLAGDFEIENRMMMEIDVEKGDGNVHKFLALNDCVISKQNAEMISLGLYAGDEKVSEYIADGLIISTPTGSTGYSLSAGGPVADPQMKLFIATPICAHMLSARPMLLSADKVINAELFKDGDIAATVTVDGEDKCTVKSGDKVTIRRSCYVFKIVKLGRQSFYYTMMAKL
ncbi:MAG: NAD(+)/NADH kinase [Clostridia bacterium]|nr:NAD(+)/NADH kinase [Clostridia bacterium]